MEKITGKEKSLLLGLCFIFAIYAIFVSLYGADASMMEEYYSIGKVQMGLLTTIQGIGGLAVSLVCVFWGERFNKLNAISFGLLLMSAGAIATAFSGRYGMALIFALAAGIGYTFIDIMSNAAVVDVFPQKTKTMLPTIHMSFGIGAMVGPYFGTAVVDSADLSTLARPFWMVGLAGIAVLILFIVSAKRIMPNTPYAKDARKSQGKAEKQTGVFSQPAAWVMLAAGILYFSFQKGIMTWYPSYLHDSVGQTLQISGLILTLFFVGALAARIASPFLFNRFNIKKMTIFFTILSGCFMIAAIAVAPYIIGLAIAFTVLGGLFQGIFCAAFIFLVCNMFPGQSAAATSVVLISINIAIIVAPLWMGGLAETIGFGIPLYIVAGMMIGSTLLIAIAHKINDKRTTKKCLQECME